MPDAYAAAKAINALVDVARGRARVLPRPPRALARAVARRRGAHRRDPVDGLHGHADDGERVLPDLPAARARARARGSSGRRRRARVAPARALPASRTSPASRRSRSLPGDPHGAAPRRRHARRSAATRCCTASLRRGAARRRARRRSRAALRRSASSAPTRSASTTHYSVGEVAKWFLYHVAELDLSLGVLPFAALLLLALGLRTRLADRDADLRRRGGLALLLARPRGGDLRVRAVVPDRGAEHVLRRAALPDRAPRLDRARRVPRGTGGRRSRLAVAAALPRRRCRTRGFIGLNADLGHARAPAARMARRARARRSTTSVSSSSVGAPSRRGAVPVRAAPLRARAAGARARLLRRLAAADRRRAPLRVAQLALRRNHERRTATGSTAPSAGRRTSRRSGRGARTSSRSGRTSSSTAASARSTRTGPAAPGRPAADAGRRRPQRPAICSPRGRHARPRAIRAHGRVARAAGPSRPQRRDEADDSLPRSTDRCGRSRSSSGLYPGTRGPGEHVTYTRHDCRGGTLSVQLQSDTTLFTRAERRRRADRRPGRGARAGRSRTSRRRSTSRCGPTAGRCIVRFTVSHTAVPDGRARPAEPDPRRLGMHFNRFAYRP